MMIKLELTNKKIEKVLRHRAMREILLLMSKDPYKSYTISDIARKLGMKPNTGYLRSSIQALIDAKLLEEEKIGRGRLLKINKNILVNLKDPYLAIPQEKYREIVKKINEKILECEGVQKVILFGGVARGTADRMSDIDLIVVTENVMAIEDYVAKIAYDCRIGKMFEERYEVSIRVVEPIELENPKSFLRDAIIEGIVLYGGD
ncbi:MAG: nucleotidyltransferase domain-containing protein [Methanosarcinales archaeon]